jgi:hypothetical protein
MSTEEMLGMTLQEAAGIKGIREVSENTSVVEYASGHCRPASPLERRLWALLLGLNTG